MYSTTRPDAEPDTALPRALFVLPVVIFVMVTSEFMISPLLPQLADALDRPPGEISLLVTALALGQSIGGVTLGVALARLRPGIALTGITLAFAAFQAAPLVTDAWPALLGARALAGALMASMFTVALTTAGALVPGPLVARASGVVFSGVTFGLTLGSPLAGGLGSAAGWQWAFAAVSIGGVLSAAAALAVFRSVPATPSAESSSTESSAAGVPTAAGESSAAGEPTERAPAAGLRSPALWATYAAALLIVGAAASAYSFFGALLAERAGLAGAAVSAVLLGYGLVSIAGNVAVARFAGARPARVLAVLTLVGSAGYLVAALGADRPAVLIGAVLAVGAVGFTANPALMALVVRHSGNRPLTNALAATSVTLGIALGSATAGALVDAGLGLASPLLLAALAAVLALGAVRFAAGEGAGRG